MEINSLERKALIESAQYVKKQFQHESDHESVVFCKNIDTFVTKLRLVLGCNLTVGEVRNSCMFLQMFIEDAPQDYNTVAHKLLLARLTETLL